MLNFKTDRALSELTPALLGDAPKPSDNHQAKNQIADARPTVMIFGETDEVRALFKFLLESWNYDVTEAAYVEQLLAVADRRRPDLVLMDTKLVFLDSLIAVKKIKNHPALRETPFVLISGHAQTTVRQTALAAGAHDLVVKPVNFELLRGVLEAYLGKSASTDNVF